MNTEKLINEKLVSKLQSPLEAEFIHLDGEDGISGYIVSKKFDHLTMTKRQKLIEQALKKIQLSKEEQGSISMIAALTPAEYDSVGAPIKIHRLRELGNGHLELMLRGTLSDANYVKARIEKLAGVAVATPYQEPGAIGIFWYLKIQNSESAPLTTERLASDLEQEKYIRFTNHASAN